MPAIQSTSKTINMATITSTHPILTFYWGTSPDYEGRTLTKILTKWSDEELEYNHNYIQLLFPLPEASGVSSKAPIVNREVFMAFRESEELRGQLLKAFERMLRFYGFKLVDGRNLQPNSVWWSGKIVVIEGPNFSEKSQHWLHRFNHNHLRITRIVRCLRVLGLEEEAIAFHTAVKKVSKGKVGETTLAFWDRAMFSALNNAPEEKNPGPNKGPRFLVEYEEKNQKAAVDDDKDE